jgi:methyltransferase (TIGR00027 family)
MEAEPSRTAMLAALARGLHRLEDASPWLLDDPFALMLVGSAWPELVQVVASLMPDDLLRQARAGITVRSRYTEDRLLEGRFAQYVILGAGLDSFAWRRPDLLGSVSVFEVDHPASQGWKRERADELALPGSDRHIFAPVDFEVDSLRSGLEVAGFDWTRPTMFSWLGVTPYLTRDAIAATLRTIATCAAGSEVALTYWADRSVVDEAGQKLIEILTPITAQSGEPLQDEYTRGEIEQLVEECSLGVHDHPDRGEILRRYFARRTDGLVPWTIESLLLAAVI